MFSLLRLCYVERNRKQSIQCASGDEGVKSSSGGRQVHSCFTAGSYEREDVTFLRSVCSLSSRATTQLLTQKETAGERRGRQTVSHLLQLHFQSVPLPSLHPHTFSPHVLPFLLPCFLVFIAPSFLFLPLCSRLLTMFTSLCPASSPSYLCVW